MRGSMVLLLVALALIGIVPTPVEAHLNSTGMGPVHDAEFFNLFNHPNVAQINPVFGSNVTPITGFERPIEGFGARQIQFSLDFEF